MGVSGLVSETCRVGVSGLVSETCRVGVSGLASETCRGGSVWSGQRDLWGWECLVTTHTDSPVDYVPCSESFGGFSPFIT